MRRILFSNQLTLSQGKGEFILDKRNPLNAEETRVILNKGTERAFTLVNIWDHKIDGVYICRQCETPVVRCQG